MIEPRDDQFHDRDAWGDWDRTHWWNESGWFGFNVPERSISGFFYVHQRPNFGVVWAGTALWGPGGQREDILWEDWNLHPLPEGSEVFDFTLENDGNPFAVQTVDLLKTYRFSYKADGYQANLTFDAFTIAQDDVGMDNYAGTYAPRHYEQFGTMKGELELDGERIEVDCFTGRDRSWGPFRPKVARGCFPWAVASKDHLFQAYCTTDQDPAADPLFGTTERVIGGWHLKDGEIGRFVSGERTATRADNSRPVREELHAIDSLGREVHAVGEVRNGYFFRNFPNDWWWWGLTEWDIDGVPAWGETQDHASALDWRRMLRKVKSWSP